MSDTVLSSAPATDTPPAQPSSPTGGLFAGKWFPLLILLPLALSLRLHHLEYRGFWTDEFKTLNAAHLPMAELVRERMANGHFPTYFIIVRGTIQLAGNDREGVVRMPTVLASVAGLIVLYCLALHLWGASCAMWAGLIYSIHERSVWAAQEARPYAFVILCAIASMLALVKALETRKARWWIAYGLCNVLGLAMHGSYVFFFLAQLTGMAWAFVVQRRFRWDWLAVMALQVMAGVGLYLWLHSCKTAAGAEYRLPGWPHYNSVCEAFNQVIWGDDNHIFPGWARYPLVASGAAMLILSWRVARGTTSHFHLILIWTLSGVLFLPLISGLIGEIDMEGRYFSFGIGGSCLLLGLTLSRFKPEGLRWPLAIGALLISGTLSYGFSEYAGTGIREAIRYVAERRGAEELVFFCGSSRETSTQYYALGAKPIRIDDKETSRGNIRHLIKETAKGLPGFWVITHKVRHEPLSDVLAEFEPKRYRQEKLKEYRSAKVYHFVSKRDD